MTKYPMSRTNHEEVQRFHYAPAPIRVSRSDEGPIKASLKNIYAGTRAVLAESTRKTSVKKLPKKK